MKPLLVLLALPVVLAASCTDLTDETGTVRVQAPAGKCWSGSIGDSTKEGCGTRSIRVEGESIIVAVVQKQTPGRWKLTVRVRVGDELKDVSSTSAEYGIATASE